MRRGGASIPTNTPTAVIVEEGPYKISRNPIYLSMVVLLVDIGLWSNSAWFIAFAAVDAISLNFYVIVPEEKHLERKFGEEYLRYKRRVRRWL